MSFRRKTILPFLLAFLILPCFAAQKKRAASKKKTGRKLLRVTFVDVGQGDCELIQTPGGKVILIDSGSGGIGWNPFDAGTKIVVPFLKKMGIKKIDYAVMTHPHSDHIGGLRAVVNKFEVGLLVDNGFPPVEPDYEEVMKIADKKNIPLMSVRAGDTLNWDKYCSFKVLSPPKKFIMDEHRINENSIVIRMDYRDVSFLFTGDAERQAGRLMVKRYRDELLCTVMKVSHHGSKNSLTKKWFLDWAQPIIAVIEVGQNTWGHPNPSSIKHLHDYGARVYRTDRDGNVQIVTDGKRYKTRFIHFDGDDKLYGGGAH